MEIHTVTHMIKKFLFLFLLLVSTQVYAASADRTQWKTDLDAVLTNSAPDGSFTANIDNALRDRQADETVWIDELEELAQPYIDAAINAISFVGDPNYYVPTDDTCTTDMTDELEAFLVAHDGFATIPAGSCLKLSDLGAGIKNTTDMQIKCAATGRCDFGHINTDSAILYHPDDNVVLGSQTEITAVTTANINLDDILPRLTVASVSGYSIGDIVKIHDSIAIASRFDSSDITKKTISSVAWDGVNSKCVVTFTGSHGYSATSRIMIKGVTATVAGTKIDYIDGSDGLGRTYNVTLGDGSGASTTTKLTLQALDNATDTTAGTDVNCDTGTYSSGGQSASSPGWAGEANQIVGIDTTNNYIFLAAPLKYSEYYAQSPQLYRFTKARKFSLEGIKGIAIGDTSDVSITVSDPTFDIRGIPDALFKDVRCDDVWDACIIRRSSPFSKIENLFTINLKNMGTNDASGTPKTITAISATNPAVFTSVAHGFSNGGNGIYLSGMPAGYETLNNIVCRVSDKTNDTFQCKDTYGNYLSANGFVAFSGTATAGETANVTGLGYGYSDYGTAFGSTAYNVTCVNGRHCRTSDAQTATWNAKLTSGSSVIQKGQPVYTMLDGGLAIGAFGVAFDTHEEDAEATMKNIQCIAPERGPQFGSYEGRCIQVRGLSMNVDGYKQYGGNSGVRIVATNHGTQQPEYWFNNVDIRGLDDINDDVAATQSTSDSNGIYIADTNSSFITQDNTNTKKPKLHLSNARFEGMFTGIVGETDAEIYAQNVLFKDITQPVYARPGTNFEFESVVDDRRNMNVSGLEGTSVTSVSVGTGSKSFTTQSSERYRVKMSVLAYSAGSPSNYMLGTVTDYDSTTGVLDITVSKTGGSGSYTDWVIQADFGTVTLGSDADDGGATVRIEKMHSIRNRALPSTLFTEFDTTAAKYYDYGDWTDTNSVATIAPQVTSPNASTLNLKTDVSRISGKKAIEATTANAFSVRQAGSSVNLFNIDTSVASSDIGVTIQPQTAATDNAAIYCTASDSTCNLVLGGYGATRGINFQPDRSDGTTRFRMLPYSFSLTPTTNGTAGTADVTYTAPADTGLTASTNAPLWKLDFSATREHATGALASQYDFWMLNSTHSAVGASTITDAASFYIDDAPQAGANVTITNPYSIFVNNGIARFDDGLVTKYPLTTLDTGGVASTPTLANQTNYTYINTGSTSKANITLPSASVTDGVSNYKACVIDADGIRITAQSGDFIYNGSSASTSGGYIESTTIGSCIELIIIDTTNWMAISSTGTWVLG